MEHNKISMHGSGFYNDNCTLQGIAIDAFSMTMEPVQISGTSITLADYGCSEGKNSIRLLAKYLDKLPFVSSATLAFNDTPHNDFSSLSTIIDASWPILSQNGKRTISPLMVPRSFFHQVLPDNFVDAGFSFTTLHWLQHMPSKSSEHPVLAAAAHEDLVSFLSSRYREIRPGGTLTLCIPSHGDIGVAPAVRCLEATVRGLSDTYPVDPSVVTRLPLYFRTMSEICSAVEATNDNWRIKQSKQVPIMHPSWSSIISTDSYNSDVVAARDRYASGITGLTIAACSQFLVDDLKAHTEDKLSNKATSEYIIPTVSRFLEDLTTCYKENFLLSYTEEKVGFTYVFLELQKP